MKKYIVAIAMGIALAALICVAIVIPMEKATAESQNPFASYEEAAEMFIENDFGTQCDDVEIISIEKDDRKKYGGYAVGIDFVEEDGTECYTRVSLASIEKYM